VPSEAYCGSARLVSRAFADVSTEIICRGDLLHSGTTGDGANLDLYSNGHQVYYARPADYYQCHAMERPGFRASALSRMVESACPPLARGTKQSRAQSSSSGGDGCHEQENRTSARAAETCSAGRALKALTRGDGIPRTGSGAHIAHATEQLGAQQQCGRRDEPPA